MGSRLPTVSGWHEMMGETTRQTGKSGPLCESVRQARRQAFEGLIRLGYDLPTVQKALKISRTTTYDWRQKMRRHHSA